MLIYEGGPAITVILIQDYSITGLHIHPDIFTDLRLIRRLLIDFTHVLLGPSHCVLAYHSDPLTY